MSFDTDETDPAIYWQEASEMPATNDITRGIREAVLTVAAELRTANLLAFKTLERTGVSPEYIAEIRARLWPADPKNPEYVSDIDFHGPWNKEEQRYEDGCHEDTRTHARYRS